MLRMLRFVLVMLLGMTALTALTTGTAGSASAAVDISRGGHKTCSDGQHVVIRSFGSGWIRHKFSARTIGSGEAKVFNHRFGAPTSYDARVTFTWRKSVWWQVQATDHSGGFDADINSIDIDCVSTSARQPDGVQVDGSGRTTCPKGQYVWLVTKYIGKIAQRWRKGPNAPWRGRTGTSHTQINYSVIPTWRRTAAWRVTVWGDDSRYLGNWRRCSKYSGGDND